jgi:large subunit ribosomal protein L6
MQTRSDWWKAFVNNKINMLYITKRHIIKIPINISMYYCTNHNTIIFTNSSAQKALKLKTQLIIDKKEKILKVTREPLYGMSNNERKKLKSIQTTQVALLKQALLDVSLLSCKKLKLVGIGFRVSSLKISGFNLLYFKLGYSHAIYFRVPETLNAFCLKSDKLYIIGNTSVYLTQIAALIRSYKSPEPYKGKGILYTSEKIALKEGKKI